MTVLAGRIWMRSAVTFLSVLVTFQIDAQCMDCMSERYSTLSPVCALLYPGVRENSNGVYHCVLVNRGKLAKHVAKVGTRSLRQSCSGQEMCLFLIPLRYTVETRGVSSHGEGVFLKTSSSTRQRYKSRNYHLFLCRKLHSFAFLQKNSTALLWVSVPVEDRFSRSACFTRSGPDHNLLEQILKIVSKWRNCLNFLNNFNAYQYIVTWCDMSILKTTKSIVLSSARASWAPRSRKALWNLKVAFISSLVQPSTAHLFGPIATASNQDANKKIEQEGW